MKLRVASCLMLTASCAFADRPVPLDITYFTEGSGVPFVESDHDYGFVVPVKDELLDIDPATYQPSMDDRYFMSVFGPRYKAVSSSNIQYFDFHQGSDITSGVSHDGVNYDETNRPGIVNMCDGVVHEIVDGTDEELEQIETGRSVEVKCDALYQETSWGNVYIAYRHLSAIDPAITEEANVVAGQAIGTMGDSGVTENVHLHLSIRRRGPDGTFNVHPMRVFSRSAFPHLLAPLTNAAAWQLESTRGLAESSSILFRIAVPHNMANIKNVRLQALDSSYLKEYDFEQVSDTSGAARDQNDFVDGIELYAYAFNRGLYAYQRFLETRGSMPQDYPAGRTSAPTDYFPILKDGLLATPAYVLDVRFRGLPLHFDPANYELQVTDVFGYGFRTRVVPDSSPATAVAFAPISDDVDDGEELANGEVTLTDGDLELAQPAASGRQIVALKFRDLGIASGAESTVLSSYVQFTADEAHEEASRIRITADETAADLVESPLNLSARGDATKGHEWEPAPWPAVGDASLAQRSVDISTLLTGLARVGPGTLDDVVLLFEGVGHRVADARRASSHAAPFLYAEYVSTVGDGNGFPVVTLEVPTIIQVFALGATYPIHIAAVDDSTSVTAQVTVNGVPHGSFPLPVTLQYEASGPGTAGVLVKALDSDGAFVTSSTSFVLDVDSDTDGIPDAFESANGMNPADSTDAALDVDGDGRSSLVEYLADSDPNVADTPASRLLNISTRGLVRTDDEVMIGGVIIGGSESKQVVIRARGPSLAQFNVPHPLSNPWIELFDQQGQRIDSNDDWQDHVSADQIPVDLQPTVAAEAAIATTLSPGAYTAIVRGVSDEQGIGIVEIFEVSATGSTRLANISTRGYIGTGDDVLIGGVIIDGNLPKTVTFRARGPSMAAFGVPNTVADPWMELYDQQGTLIDTNDNWQDHTSASVIGDNLKPTDSNEAAITRTLDPGAYTAIVRGVGEGVGIGIVEVFEVD